MSHIYNGSVEPYNNRYTTLVIFRDDKDYFIHGVVIAPKSYNAKMTKIFIDNIYANIENYFGTEWNYDDIISVLKDNGFDVLHPDIWLE